MNKQAYFKMMGVVPEGMEKKAANLFAPAPAPKGGAKGWKAVPWLLGGAGAASTGVGLYGMNSAARAANDLQKMTAERDRYKNKAQGMGFWESLGQYLKQLFGLDKYDTAQQPQQQQQQQQQQQGDAGTAPKADTAATAQDAAATQTTTTANNQQKG